MPYSSLSVYTHYIIVSVFIFGICISDVIGCKLIAVKEKQKQKNKSKRNYKVNNIFASIYKRELCSTIYCVFSYSYKYPVISTRVEQ